MIDRPIHSVNLVPGQDVPAEVALPTIHGLDLDVSVANVARWGGDGRRYVAALAAASNTSPTPEQFRDIAAVAAWRAGVIGLRGAALRAIRAVPAETVGAVIGLSSDQVPAFVRAQETDRFSWPGWRADYSFLIARVGGFTGLGGPWSTPPRAVQAVSPGRWIVTADGSTWNVEVDIFGHAITPGEPTPSASEGRELTTATLRTRPTSYLLDVVREPGS